MAKKFEVTGLKKKQYRGSSVPTVDKKIISADNAEKAKQKFEKENQYYNAVGAVELGELDQQIRTHDAKSEKVKEEEKEKPEKGKKDAGPTE